MRISVALVSRAPTMNSWRRACGPPCCFIANIGIQALFVYLLGATQLTKPTYNREAVLQFRSWRRNEAHSIYNMDLQSLSSLGSRVCKGDVISQSGDISETYQEVDEYLGEDMPHGTLMLLLALIAWYCTISKEIHASMDAFHKVMALPRASSTTIVHHRSDQYYCGSTRWSP